MSCKTVTMGNHESTGLPGAEQLAQMARHGHLTPEEVQILQSDQSAEDLAPLVLKVRERHARTRLEHALADGSPTANRAEALLERVRRGEHDKELRAVVISLADTTTPQTTPPAHADPPETP